MAPGFFVGKQPAARSWRLEKPTIRKIRVVVLGFPAKAAPSSHFGTPACSQITLLYCTGHNPM